MRNTKKALAIALLMICIFSFVTVYCHADNSPEIMPRWNNIGDVSTAFTFYDDIGEAVATASRGNMITSMVGTITIYKYQNNDWIYVDSISKTTTRSTLGIVLEIEGTSGAEYKMEFLLTAYNGTTVMEKITDVKYATCP